MVAITVSLRFLRMVEGGIVNIQEQKGVGLQKNHSSNHTTIIAKVLVEQLVLKDLRIGRMYH